MKKYKLLPLLAFFMGLFLASAQQDLQEIRTLYIDAADSEEKTENLYQSVSSFSGEDQVLLAYQGAATTMKAKYGNSIKEKKELFLEGKEYIEEAVNKDPKNTEVRFIRLTVQENSPGILNYKSNIEEDKQVVLDTFASLSKDLQDYIKNYIETSAVFSDEEKSRILD